MTKKQLFFVLAAYLAVAAAQGVKKSDDDDEDGFDFDCIIDILNVVMFIFAGGPEEVALRIGVMVLTILAAFVAASLCLCCCGDSEPCLGRRGRKTSTFDNLVRAVSFCESAGGCLENAHKYCD